MIRSPFEVEVNGKTLTTRNIIIATGARALVPPIPGLDKIDYWTSDNLWSMRRLPKRLVVLGGGPIGCEMAQCFARFGSAVALIGMGPQILMREDADAAAVVAIVGLSIQVPGGPAQVGSFQVGLALALAVNHYMVNTGLDLSALGNVSIMGVAWDPIWRSQVSLETYTKPTAALLSIIGVAVLYPALRAALIRPLDAIHD